MGNDLDLIKEAFRYLENTRFAKKFFKFMLYVK